MAKARSTKKLKEKAESRKKDVEEIGHHNFFSLKELSYAILFAIFLFSFYIRGIMPIKAVFQGGIVGFASDDSIFHMRLVENTIQFFPHRIIYDAFTYYPLGMNLHWGPLFDQINAFLAIVAGLLVDGGMPSQTTIDTIGAFYPAVLGALVVFPVYFIGKELLNEKAGLLGAFLIAIMPGAFLGRSTLGFTDNHIAEVFYLTWMMMFFIMAIKKAENITFDHWLDRDWAKIKIPMIYSILAGIFFGAYLLNWANGVFFAAVFGIFVIIQYIIDHFRSRSTEYLGVVGIIAYIVAMIMVMPYVEISRGFNSGLYSLLHLAVTGGGAVVFAFFSLISREMNRQEYKGYYYLVFVCAALLFGLIFIKIFIPDFYSATMGNWEFMFTPHTDGPATIGEAHPLSFAEGFGSFGYNYILSYISIIVLCYYVIKKSNAEYTLLVVWSFFVIAIMLAQVRFTYYYAVNASILSGLLCSRFLDYADWKTFDSKDIMVCLKRIRVRHILSIIIVIAVTVFLPSEASPYKMTMEMAPWGTMTQGYYEWHDAMTWMRYNTPQPDLPYYSIYERPAPDQKYNYSINDYGVMSWWDYGHMITYWGHRIPNANPFQAGIGGGGTHAPGASTYLTAGTEDEANAVLEKLGTNGKPGARYVASNAYMAYAIQSIFADWDMWHMYEEGYYAQVQTSGGYQYWPTMKYFNTMESRLHILDTTGLHNYRLVHESTPNPRIDGGTQEKSYKSIYNIINKNNPIPVEDSGFVKIFEYVKGAKITGKALPNTTVTLTNTIKTNLGRTFQYKQTVSSDGSYVFVVPYSTTGPIPGETQFDTGPQGAFSVTAGAVSKQVDINEKDVLEGGTIILDMV